LNFKLAKLECIAYSVCEVKRIKREYFLTAQVRRVRETGSRHGEQALHGET
jgi:hypothetical protein